MKRVVRFSAVFMCMLAMTFLGVRGVQAEVGVTDDTILLGSFQDMSGPGAYLGKLCTTTMKVWMGYVNNDLGGIHGH